MKLSVWIVKRTIVLIQWILNIKVVQNPSGLNILQSATLYQFKKKIRVVKFLIAKKMMMINGKHLKVDIAFLIKLIMLAIIFFIIKIA